MFVWTLCFDLASLNPEVEYLYSVCLLKDGVIVFLYNNFLCSSLLVRYTQATLNCFHLHWLEGRSQLKKKQNPVLVRIWFKSVNTISLWPLPPFPRETLKKCVPKQNGIFCLTVQYNQLKKIINLWKQLPVWKPVVSVIQKTLLKPIVKLSGQADYI